MAHNDTLWESLCFIWRSVHFPPFLEMKYDLYSWGVSLPTLLFFADWFPPPSSCGCEISQTHQLCLDLCFLTRPLVYIPQVKESLFIGLQSTACSVPQKFELCYCISNFNNKGISQNGCWLVLEVECNLIRAWINKYKGMHIGTNLSL